MPDMSLEKLNLRIYGRLSHFRPRSWVWGATQVHPALSASEDGIRDSASSRV